jgi:hypothetical protein
VARVGRAPDILFTVFRKTWQIEAVYRDITRTNGFGLCSSLTLPSVYGDVNRRAVTPAESRAGFISHSASAVGLLV